MLLYIYNLVPLMRNSSRHPNRFKIFSCITDYIKNGFLLSVFTEWNKLDLYIQNSSSEGYSVMLH